MERLGQWLQKWGCAASIGVGASLLVWNWQNLFAWMLLVGGLVVGLEDWLLSIGKRHFLVRTEKALVKALAELDTIIEGKRLVGATSEVVDTQIGPLILFSLHVPRAALLCRTATGNWFLFQGHLHELRLTHCSVEMKDEGYAKQWFSNDIGKYSKYFGEPDVL